MAKVEGTNIQRAQRQHSSVVVVIPKIIRRALDIKPGDYVVFTSYRSSAAVELSKFIPGVSKDGKSARHSGQ